MEGLSSTGQPCLVSTLSQISGKLKKSILKKIYIGSPNSELDVWFMTITGLWKWQLLKILKMPGVFFYFNFNFYLFFLLSVCKYQKKLLHIMCIAWSRSTLYIFSNYC